MKFIEFLKKYQLILFLSFLVVIFIVVKLVYGNKDETSNIAPIVTPTPIVFLEPTVNAENFKTETTLDINDNYPLGQILPYSTKNFIVERYTKPLVLEVEALNEDKVLVEKEVKEWIEKNGPDPTTHKIVWK